MRVLVVDDSATLRKIAIRAVRDAGFGAEFAEASGGAEALEVLAKQDVALVLSDLNMPGMDGIELARRVHGRRVPIVVMASAANLIRAHEALQSGADDYLLHPFTPAQLQHKLGRFLG
jgi:CheY-like chemotaxis protein